ncbi:MAG TPA: DUF6754 domain-containing protein [Kofleriaceae bacterium]|nr:DUF6754 domain-containing protein [Kofleriaceae bacterium]
MRRCAAAYLAGLPALVLSAALAVAQPVDPAAGPPAAGAPVAPALEEPATDRLAPPSEPAPPPPAPPPAPPPPAPAPVRKLEVKPVKNDDGRHLMVTFERAEHPEGATIGTAILRRKAGAKPEVEASALAPLLAEPLKAPKAGSAIGGWTLAALLEGGEQSFRDEVAPGTAVEYAAFEVVRDGDGNVVATSDAATAGPRTPEASLFHGERWGVLLIVLLISGFVWFYVRVAKARPKDIYVRRMPGVDALEDAVGRSTEMGRPVLYVTGLEEIQDLMTIASLLILGHVSELTANYDTEIKVANYYPMTMVVAEEIVRQGYANAGRVDAHRPENVLFITAEQFAFAAGVNGLILRDKPATNIYFGKFFGESLLLAETGYTTGAIQIAGTAELAQLPFFIAACDYTLIGEELYATSAYLSREPTLLANLKAGDAFKMIAMAFIVVAVALATMGIYDLGPKVFP